MGRGNINGILTWVIVLLVIFVVGNLFISLLPYLLIGGLILWAVFKIKGISKKKGQNEEETVTYERTTYTTNTFESEASEKVIDVDYEDVEK